MGILPKKQYSFVFYFGHPVVLARRCSGFKPVVMGGPQPLFSDLRLAGTAAMVNLGYVAEGGKVAPLGWYEDNPENIQYEADEEMIFRPWAQAMMLHHDYGIPAERLEPIVTGPSTWEHMPVIKQMLVGGTKGCLFASSCAIISNRYHHNRIQAFLSYAHITGIDVLDAESFLIEQEMVRGRSKGEVLERWARTFSDRDYSLSMAHEAVGFSNLIGGTYNVSDNPVPDLKCPPLLPHRYLRPSERQANAVAATGG